jgi:hypothetical protein
MKNKQKHKKVERVRWDDIMTITVMVVSALCVLILISDYVSTTGKAYESSLPSKYNTLGMLTGATVIEGNGKAKCDVSCAREGKTCVLAKSYGEIKKCSDIIEKYNCLCASPDRIVGTVPGKDKQTLAVDIPNTCNGGSVNEEWCEGYLSEGCLDNLVCTGSKADCISTMCVGSRTECGRAITIQKEKNGICAMINNMDCEFNFQCISGNCIGGICKENNLCQNSQDCSTGYYCPEGPTTIEGRGCTELPLGSCTKDEDCNDEKICKLGLSLTGLGTCVLPSCTSNDDCPERYYCPRGFTIDGTWTCQKFEKGECLTNEDCLNNKVCNLIPEEVIGTCEGACTDNDNDGYCEDDCDNNDPTVNPSVNELCEDNIDNDCDGMIDCIDSDCIGGYVSGEGFCCQESQTCGLGTNCGIDNICKEVKCYDNINNDNDKEPNGVILTDCLDIDCNQKMGSEEKDLCEFGTELTCNDGFDNDADGITDCVDPDCLGKVGITGPCCQLDTNCFGGVCRNYVCQ